MQRAAAALRRAGRGRRSRRRRARARSRRSRRRRGRSGRSPSTTATRGPSAGQVLRRPASSRCHGGASSRSGRERTRRRQLPQRERSAQPSAVRDDARRSSERSARSAVAAPWLRLDVRARRLDQPVVLHARRDTTVTHAMQPRQRSKCSTTVSVERDRAVDERAHQVDAAARRVHLLVPQRVGRARRQAEAAVHAVGDQLGLHSASTTRSASGLHAGSRASSTYATRGPGRTSGASLAVPAAPPGQASPAARAARPTGRPPRRRARAACASTDARRAFEQHMHASARRDRPRSARAASGAASCQRARRSRPCATRRAAGAAAAQAARRFRAGRASRRRACRGRSRRRSSRPCRRSSRASRPAASTVTPITRSRIVPKRWRSGPDRSSTRHSASVGSPGGSSDRRCPCSASAACSADEAQRALDDARQVAGLVLDDQLRSGRQGRPARADGRGTGPGTSPQSRGVGKTLPGFASPCGSKARAEPLHRLEVVLAEHQRHRARLVGADAVLAGDRAARVDARLEDLLGQLLGALRLAVARGRRRGRADAGCRRRRGRRCRRAARARATARRSGAAPPAAASAARRRPGRSSSG